MKSLPLRSCLITAAFLLLLSLLLPSCVRWNIGERIRSATAVYVGADTRHPVDGKIYRSNCQVYMYAPEVTFRMRLAIVEPFAVKVWPRRTGLDVTPTGRIVLVENDWIDGPKLVDELPPDCRVLEGGNWTAELHFPIENNELGLLPGGQNSRGSLGAQIFAAPFDYCIDPLLSAVTSPLWLPILGIYMLLED